MNLKDEIQEARSKHTIQSILGTNKRLIVCPLPTHQHRNNSPSFSIFWNQGVQLFQCHGNCGLRGDVVDLVGYLRVPNYNPHDHETVRQAITLLDNRYPIVEVKPEKTVRLAGDEWLDFLPPGPEVSEYAKTRGLMPETLKKFKIGQSGEYMTMPSFQDGKLMGIKMRNILPRASKENRFKNLFGSVQTLFNYDAISYTTKPVLLVKGEIPCMLLDQLGFLACAPTGGEGGWNDKWRLALALAKVIVVGDNDPTGVKYAEDRAAFLHGETKFPPAQFKDIDQWILADPTAVSDVRRWMEVSIHLSGH